MTALRSVSMLELTAVSASVRREGWVESQVEGAVVFRPVGAAERPGDALADPVPHVGGVTEVGDGEALEFGEPGGHARQHNEPQTSSGMSSPSKRPAVTRSAPGRFPPFERGIITGPQPEQVRPAPVRNWLSSSAS